MVVNTLYIGFALKDTLRKHSKNTVITISNNIRFINRLIDRHGKFRIMCSKRESFLKEISLTFESLSILEYDGLSIKRQSPL